MFQKDIELNPIIDYLKQATVEENKLKTNLRLKLFVLKLKLKFAQPTL